MSKKTNIIAIADELVISELVKAVVDLDIAALRAVEGKAKNNPKSSETFRMFSNESEAAKALLVVKVGTKDEAERLIELGHDLIGKLIRNGEIE